MSYPQETFTQTDLIRGSLLERRRHAVSMNTLRYQLDVLKKTGRYQAFDLKWQPIYGDEPEIWPVPKHLFWDSDVAKWIEGACYLLHDSPDKEMDHAVHELVQMIRSAQQPDGYINIHYTVVEPGKRFTNLRDMHELYNCGHLIEAALAHHQHYGNDQLLEPMTRYVDLLCRKFGPGEDQIHGYPGHPEIELSLLRLHARTGDAKHLALARYFVNERGNPKGAKGKHFFDAEREARGEDRRVRPEYHPQPGGCKWYYQAHLPIAEQPTIEGHSVRAMYLLTAVSDLVRMEKSQNHKLQAAVTRLWRNMVDCKMYLTGGIGAIKQYEGFGLDYFLPQSTDEGGCYAETCASIGIMMLANRMLQYDLSSEYADVIELCLYNNVLTAMSHNGKAFTYENQLASSETDLASRSEWFTVACCPPNVLRVLGSVGGYAYSQQPVSSDKTSLNVHLFIPSVHKFMANGTTAALTQKNSWPWSSDLNFELRADDSQQIELNLRIPQWATSWKLFPELPSAQLSKGYLSIPSAYLRNNPKFTLSVPLKPRLIAPYPSTRQDTLTLARGPIVYCVEDVDNDWVTDHFRSLELRADCKIEENQILDKVTGDDYVGLTVRDGASIVDLKKLPQTAGAVAVKDLDNLKSGAKTVDELKFVPFYFRSNRGGKGHSRVGIRRCC